MSLIFDKIEERDVDFVVMRAFYEHPEFLSLFLDKAGYKTGNVIKIEHSFTDNELGESDITVVVAIENKNVGLLIENKIDAKAMREQCARYIQRGNRGKISGEYDEFKVFIIAPQSYIDSNNEAQKYENQISYEELLHFFVTADKSYDAEIIRAAIMKEAQGYTVQEVPAITDFWRKLYDYCSASGKQIEMYDVDGPKGPRSTWLQFKIPLKGAALYYKANQGVCDLQFGGKLHESLRLKTELAKFIDSDMHWADTGASLSLRIKVVPMDFKIPFEEHITETDAMLNAIEKLTMLAVKLNDIGYVL